MKRNVVPSQETQQDAIKIANATQKPGQTKEQTKLIAQGIEKGIALYKKQQKEKARQADKAKKKALRAKRVDQESEESTQVDATEANKPASNNALLPWSLLILSWVGFAVYLMQNH